MKDVTIMPLDKRHAGGAADILREAFPWCYGGQDADEEVQNMLEAERIALAAIADGRVAGIIGAIPQYGILRMRF